MSNKQLMEQLMKQNEEILKSIHSLNQRVESLEKGGKTSKSTTKKSVSATKSKSKKTESSKTQTQTREERLEEKYGDKATRTKFVELRKKVADEFSALAKEHEVFIPKKSYTKVLTQTTESLNGKFNKATVKKAFLAAAK